MCFGTFRALAQSLATTCLLAQVCLLFNRTFLRSFLSNKKSPSLIIKDEFPRVTTLNSAVPHGHRPHRLSKTAWHANGRFRHRLTRFPLSPAQLRDHLLPPLCSPFSPTGVSESFLSAYSSLPSFFHMMSLVYPVQINLSRYRLFFRRFMLQFSHASSSKPSHKWTLIFLLIFYPQKTTLWLPKNFFTDLCIGTLRICGVS